jgi:hypothetical protein
MRTSRFGDREKRGRRRRAFWAMLRWAVALGAVALAGTYAYDAGLRLANRETQRLGALLASAEADKEAAVAERDALATELAASKAETETWRQRHTAEVPKGDVATLAALAQRRLAAGVPVDRLSFVIENVGAVRDCPEPPQTKRFLVQTPISTGAGASIGFAGGTIVVTGTGESARDAAGNPLAQFDAGRPVALHFTLIDGSMREATGTLPLATSIVVGGLEHRFSAVATDNGFVNVTGETCKFP